LTDLDKSQAIGPTKLVKPGQAGLDDDHLPGCPVVTHAYLPS
jgi:hypothetical protein